jgi:hypothetical protein
MAADGNCRIPQHNNVFCRATFPRSVPAPNWNVPDAFASVQEFHKSLRCSMLIHVLSRVQFLLTSARLHGPGAGRDHPAGKSN